MKKNFLLNYLFLILIFLFMAIPSAKAEITDYGPFDSASAYLKDGHIIYTYDELTDAFYGEKSNTDKNYHAFMDEGETNKIFWGVDFINGQILLFYGLKGEVSENKEYVDVGEQTYGPFTIIKQNQNPKQSQKSDKNILFKYEKSILPPGGQNPIAEHYVNVNGKVKGPYDGIDRYSASGDNWGYPYKLGEKYYADINDNIYGPYDLINSLFVSENNWGIGYKKNNGWYINISGSIYGPYDNAQVNNMEDAQNNWGFYYEKDKLWYANINDNIYGPYEAININSILGAKEIGAEIWGFVYKDNNQWYARIGDNIYGPYDEIWNISIKDSDYKFVYKLNNNYFININGREHGPYNNFGQYWMATTDDNKGIIYSKDRSMYVNINDNIYGPYESVGGGTVSDSAWGFNFKYYYNWYVIINGRYFGPYQFAVAPVIDGDNWGFTYMENGKWHIKINKGEMVGDGGSKNIVKGENPFQITADDHIRGNKNAKLTILYYLNFHSAFGIDNSKLIDKTFQDYGNKIKFVFRHSYASGMPDSQNAAEASECAGEQGKFWEYYDLLFKNASPSGLTKKGLVGFYENSKGLFNEIVREHMKKNMKKNLENLPETTGLEMEELKQYAKGLGLDAEKFKECLDNGKYKDKIRKDMLKSQTAIYFNEELVRPKRRYVDFKEIVEKYLSKIVNLKNNKMYSRLKGKIMLKVEDAGKAYYINPKTETMHYLGRPQDAFAVMREQGIGITNKNLEKIPVGLDNLSGDDTDGDGLPDAFEDAVGSDKNKADTDGDGHNDKSELQNNYSPIIKLKKLSYDNNFTNIHKGKIFLQVEGRGEAWYINPTDGKRYFLGRPHDAFSVMRNFGLGISNNDFDSIIK